MLCNDSNRTCEVRWAIKDWDSGKAVLEGKSLSTANENIVVGQIKPIVSEKKLYILTWNIDGREYGNHYISGFPVYDADKMFEWIEATRHLPIQFDWEV